jgi:hypothetical protein
LVTYYALFFIWLSTRRGGLCGLHFATRRALDAATGSQLCTGDCREGWAANFHPLDWVLRTTGIEIVKTPLQLPMYNAYVERFVRETRETLDNLILLG